ncbi:tyrosine-type recombinase/integrase [Aminobacter sp. P9b]|uniref:tyrosine-type recombinase/integrase n=1 Tax=Aminobacter sp. P9b TaxID=3133697 RepID=UPI0032528FB9
MASEGDGGEGGKLSPSYLDPLQPLTYKAFRRLAGTQSWDTGAFQLAKLTDYLQWHGQQYRVRLRVPAKLRPLLGTAQLIEPLHTDNLQEANERKHAIVGRMKAEIKLARSALGNANPHSAEALQLRLRHREHDPDTIARIEARAEAIGELHGGRAQAEFAEVARGIFTPLAHHADAFLAYKATYRKKSSGDFYRVLGWLEGWMKANHHSAFIDFVDRKKAGSFIDEALSIGRSRDKVAAYLGFLREYWKWLKMRGHVEENPWLDQELPPSARASRDSAPDKGKRPYVAAEIAALVYGPVESLLQAPPKTYMRDLMHIAALSGMRLEEICQLRVADCEGGEFRIRHGKTDNASREVPIHSQLAAIVKQRTEGRKPDAFLLDGLPKTPESRDTRSDPASKAFTRYRRKVKVDERPNGKAKSNVDFHSFRRWFIKVARDRLDTGEAGYSPWTIADVVGHDDEGVKDFLKLTMKHYPGPSSGDAKRALVEAVKLPARPPSPQPEGPTT